ncbi:MAG: Vms1/Ankzf1 family peptidyl-tRNA hydrolase [Candidatus Methanoperedens sp.]|nr:Vms1/Ankzf1 family peptidyl-tRNA hydrolase [Candidatus Methanoperedens sp.]MCZ7370192.1 Vms1/Ankzf1 family peptidyl-tRNA hydrolase [Candidatus Methanoperedens sp.]
MFDLFRKEEINNLKARVAQLEEENSKLSLQLGKREEKTRRTISTKQEVDRELNESRQKILSLESEIQKLNMETAGDLKFRFSENLPRSRFEDVLFLVESVQSKTSTLVSIYLEPGESLGNVAKDRINQIGINAIFLIEKIQSSVGKAIFYDIGGIIRLAMIPVFPISHSEYALERRFNLESLKKSMDSDKTLVINAHAGETFAGIIENDAFVEHDVVRSSVMGKHSKGGWSQKRFQSLIEEDVKHHSDKVRASLGLMIEKHKDIQYVIAGGEGKLIKMIMEGYNYPLIMKSMDAQGLNPQQVLRDAMSVRMYGI